MALVDAGVTHHLSFCHGRSMHGLPRFPSHDAVVVWCGQQAIYECQQTARLYGPPKWNFDAMRLAQVLPATHYLLHKDNETGEKRGRRFPLTGLHPYQHYTASLTNKKKLCFVVCRLTLL